MHLITWYLDLSKNVKHQCLDLNFIFLDVLGRSDIYSYCPKKIEAVKSGDLKKV